MRRALALVAFLVISTPAFAEVAVQGPNLGEYPPASMYFNDVWHVSVRSTLDYALSDFERGDVLVQTGDSDAPYLRLTFEVLVTCGGPWAPLADPWIVEIHSTKEAAQTRASWLQWQSWTVQAPDGRFLVVYRNPDRPY